MNSKTVDMDKDGVYSGAKNVRARVVREYKDGYTIYWLQVRAGHFAKWVDIDIYDYARNATRIANKIEAAFK